MAFVRVKHAKGHGLQHEFDVSTVMLARHPERFEVVDDKPVATARPATYRESEDPTPVGDPEGEPKKTVKRSK